MKKHVWTVISVVTVILALITAYASSPSDSAATGAASVAPQKSH